MNIKKNVLFLGIVALMIPILLWILEAKFGLNCRYINENGHTTKYCGVVTLSLLPVILLLPFSFILHFFRDEVFTAWWSFAKWWVPMIIGVTLFLNSLGGGGTLGMNNDFTAFILIILYSIFIITSLVKIVRAYLRTK